MEKRKNAWISHLQKFKNDNPNMAYKDCMREAKKTYVKAPTKMKGKGFWDSLKKVGSRVVSGAKNLLNKGANLIADQKVNKLYPGEEHGLLLLPDRPNHYARAQYMGPNTEITKRMNLGQNGLTPVDTISKKHDIAYSLAKNQQEINKADDDMLRHVERANDSQWNKNQARLIALKRGAQMLGFNIGSTYGSEELENNPQLLKKYQDEWNRLDKSGYGKKRKPRKSRGKKK